MKKKGYRVNQNLQNFRYTAIKSYLFHYEDKRSTKDAIELFSEVEKITSVSLPIPIFTSDDWNAFEEGLVNVYGKIELP